jgi:hypothetical protein
MGIIIAWKKPGGGGRYRVPRDRLRARNGVVVPQRRGEEQMAKPKGTKKEKLGIKIMVEITGHMQRVEVDQFMAALSSVVNNHLENGGNGGT